MRTLIIILAAVAIVLTACTPLTTPPSTTNTLRILTEDYPPFNFLDKSGNVVGQSAEIVNFILEKLGSEASIEMVALADGMSMAQKGPNTAMYSINRTTQRENSFKWVGSISYYEQAFYAMKVSNITLSKFEDAKNVSKIGVYKGDAGNQFLASQGFTNLDESATDVEALQKLANGKVDMWLGNTAGLAITALEAGVNPDDLIQLPTVVIRADLYVAFSKDVPDTTIASWQSILDSMKKDKDIDGKTVIEKIRAKYNDPMYLNSLLQ